MIYNCKTWPDELISGVSVLQRPRGKRTGTNKRKYIDIVGAFDIETTLIHERYSIMWIWQLQIGLDDTIIGRSWKEFTRTMQRISTLLPEDVWLCVYVHNLAYEFQFLRGVYKFRPEEVFAVQRRKPLRVDLYGHIELRCSYLHSNMRLETFLEKMKVPTQKLELDYTIKRYPWTQLTQAELDYCIADVKGLVQAIYAEMLHDGDNLYTIPATSTGYVRRDVKAAMRSLPWHYVRNMLPDEHIYNMLREAFRGGNVHANRYFVSHVLENVYSMDEASAYPCQQMLELFPVRPFRHIGPSSLEKAEDLIYRRKKPVLMRIALYDVRLTDPYWGAPYIPVDKCRALRSVAVDNGRVLSADYLEITVTDIDYKIIKEEYTAKGCKILDLASSGYGPLPEVVKNVIMNYYKLKTELKGDEKNIILYEKSKNKLNGIFGMSCQDPCKQDIIFDEKEAEAWGIDNKTIAELLEKNYRKAFFPYQWGVWTTAHARARLEDGIRLAHVQGEFVYCDTDSVKYMGDVDFTSINKKIIEKAEKAGAYADRAGKRYYMGIYEPDNGYPTRFATRGAKKYVAEDPQTGKLKATIAGVDKRDDGGHVSGGTELMENGGFSAFLRPVFVFRKAAAAKSLYNDKEYYIVKIDGHRIKIRPCVSIVENTYELKDGYSSYITKEELYYFSRDFFGK